MGGGLFRFGFLKKGEKGRGLGVEREVGGFED